MSALRDIRTAIKTTIEANIPGLRVYKRVPGSTDSLPCVVVMPGAGNRSGDVANFDVAMGRGTDTWNFLLYVFVSPGDMDVGQDALDEYISGAGSKSIRAVIFANRDLGLSDVNAHVAGMASYNQMYEYAGFDAIGAVLRLVVHTRGTA